MRYLIKFTPQEPWFFGSEKVFEYNGQEIGNDYKNSYFIKSEILPSQSTLLGALRYLLIPNKKPIGQYSNDDIIVNAERIGPNSFDADAEGQSFGAISNLSPVFIVKGNSTIIPCPMDHIRDQKKDDYYSPLNKYIEITTSAGKGKKLYTESFDVKVGANSGFLVIASDDEKEIGKVYNSDNLFGAEVRVGINRATENGGFFKKEFQYAQIPISFAINVDLDIPDDDPFICNQPHIATLGQGKSVFTVTIEPSNGDIVTTTKTFLNKYHLDLPEKYNFLLCLSDTFVSENPYNNTLFAITATKDYRSFKTMEYGKIKKGDYLRRVIKAGSVFIVSSDDYDNFIRICRNKNAANIGYNCLVCKET